MYEEYRGLGLNNESIYKRYIQKEFNISRATFYEYLKREKNEKEIIS
jgi:DNA invertase Pin-like site-specific DNA recombinase